MFKLLVVSKTGVISRFNTVTRLDAGTKGFSFRYVSEDNGEIKSIGFAYDNVEKFHITSKEEEK